MKKISIRILIISITFIFLVGFYCLLESTTKISFEAKDYTGGLYIHGEENSYQEFIDNNEINRPNLEYTISGTAYEKFVDDDFNEDVMEKEYDGVNGLFIPETGNLTYKVNISEEGFYNIKIKYYTISGRSSSILRGIKINDEYQFEEATTFTLSRIWEDEFKVEDKRVDGKHDQRPSSKEKQVWNTESIKDRNGYYDDPYLFYFKNGENVIEFVGVSEPFVIGEITIYQEKELLKYNDYLNNQLASGAKYKSEGNIEYKVQGEDTFEHNQATLTPVASYTSHTVEPYVNFLTRYNTIGGSNWSVTGDWISWKINVKEAGLYCITIKALQSYSRGLEASRVLYINDEIPFDECKCVTFHYSGDWQNVTIGDENGAYYFYFNEGENTIKLQNTIGIYSNAARIGEEVIADLNWVYRKVIMRTGVNPSKYQDYQLYSSIEGLKSTIEDCAKKLEYATNLVIKVAGERSNLISPLETTKAQLDDFLKSERNIQNSLNSLESNITSLGTWIMTISSQPLSIDYIMIHGDNVKLPKAKVNFFQKIGHEFILLIGSYGNDTSLKSSVETDGETIVVWIMSGHDQANLLRSMIDQSFTIQNNVNVDLKLVSSAVLLKAVLSGHGPDVAIGVAQNIPVNWGIRNAVVDMSKLDGFNEFKDNFYPSAITPFTYRDSVYALPDTQDFQIQFVRTDIFKELGLTDEYGKVATPKSWNEVLDLLPTLQRQYLDYYLPNVRGALSPLLYAMIEQYGGSLYLDNGRSSGLMEANSAQAFYDFVDFFRNYGFDVDVSFTNRFRTGEMPIGVANYSLYNTLSVSAPEISGNWSFAMLPGYDDGSMIHQATTSSSSATIIPASTKHINESWTFVKWWLGETAQTAYAKGMESILGSAARYATANKHAFANLPWSAKDYKILEEQRSYAVGIPTVPGDYIVGRYIDNAFRNILNDGTNPSDALYNYYLKINAELERKQRELGLN